MAELPLLGDVRDSVAFTLIEDLKRSKKVSDVDALRFRQLYELMHQRVNETLEKDATLQKLVHPLSPFLVPQFHPPIE